MARTQKELEGWEIVIKDENGNIIDNNNDGVRSRRSHRRGGVEQIFLRRIDNKDIIIGRGSSIITKAKGRRNRAGLNGVEKTEHDEFTVVSFVNDIRLNTPGALVEIWAFQYLQRSRISPIFYLGQFKPESVTAQMTNEDIRRLFAKEVDQNELFLTTQVYEPKLEEFLSLAHIMNETEWQETVSTGRKRSKSKDFLVRYIAFNYGERCVPLDLTREVETIKTMKPKEAEEHFKDILWASMSDEFKLNVKPALRKRKRKGQDVGTSVNGFGTKRSARKRDKNGKQNELKIASVKEIEIKNESESESEGESEIKNENENTVNSDLDPLAHESETDHSAEEQEQEQDDQYVEEDDSEEEEDKDAFNDSEDIDSSDEDEYAVEVKKSRRKAVKNSNNNNRGSSKVRRSSGTTASTNKRKALRSLHRKFTKKNVARSKKKYTSFSKRFRDIEDIPDLTKLDFFYRDTSEAISNLEAKLTMKAKVEVIETIFSKAKKRLYSSSTLSSSAASPSPDPTIGKEDIVKTRDFSEYLPGRENEFASIYLSVYSAIESESSTTVYIAGTPGVGKTLTVREVIQELQLSAMQGELPKFQYIEVNGLKVVKPTDCYQLLWQKISSEELTWGASMESLDFYFNKVPKDKKLPIVVLIDELDTLVTKAQDIMYNFFNWTTYANAKLVMIAIANTMDLPERHLGNKVSSRIGFTRIMFPGYTFDELKAIINLRLKGFNDTLFYVDSKTGRVYQEVDLFKEVLGEKIKDRNDNEGKVISPAGIDPEENPDIIRVKLRMTPDAIEIASRKIASVSGDARRALKVCKRATEIAEEYYMLQHSYDYGGSGNASAPITEEPASPTKKERDEYGEYEVQVVDIKHIMRALNETLNSNYVTFISRQSFTTRLFLCAFLHLIEKTGSQEQTLGDIIDEIRTLIQVNGNNKFVLGITQTLFQGSGHSSNGNSNSDNKNSSDGQDSEQLRMISWDFLIGSLIDTGIIIKQNMKNERECSVRLNVSVEEVKSAIEQDTVLKSF